MQAVVAPLGRPRVLYVLWPEPLIVPGRGALVSELIALAGGRSVTADAPSDYPRYTIEAAVASAPEVIFLARHGAGQGAFDEEKWERFRHLPAVRSRRLHAVDGSLLHRYGPRMVDGLEQLARLSIPARRPRGERRLGRGSRPARWRVLAVLAAIRPRRRRRRSSSAAPGLAAGGAVRAGGRRGRGGGDAVVLSLRLPRILVALLAGGALAVAGVGFQALTRNPLAEPSVLGVSSGAAFGVVAAQVLGLGRDAGSSRSGSPRSPLPAPCWRAPRLRHRGGRPRACRSTRWSWPASSSASSSRRRSRVLISLVDFDRLGGVIHWLLGNLAPLPPGPLAVFAAWPRSASGSCSAPRAR